MALTALSLFPEISEGEFWSPFLFSLTLWSTTPRWEAAERPFPGPAEGGWWQGVFIHLPVTFKGLFPFPSVLQRETCQFFSSQQDYQSWLPMWSFPLLKVSDVPLWEALPFPADNLSGILLQKSRETNLRETKSRGNRGSLYRGKEQRLTCEFARCYHSESYQNMPQPQLLYLRGRGWEIRGVFTDSAVMAWPGSLGAQGMTIPCKCAKCWILCGPEHCFIWQRPSFMSIQTETLFQNIIPSSSVYIWFIKGLDFFCSSVDASRPVLMLFWQCLMFIWLEIFQVIKKLHTNCCFKIYCVYIYSVYFGFGEGCFNSPSSLSESPMSGLKPKLFWSLQSQRLPLSDACLFLIAFCSLQEAIWGGCARNIDTVIIIFIIPEYAQALVIFKSGHPCTLQCLNLEVHTWEERELHPYSLSVLVTGRGLHWWALITHVSPKQGEAAFLCAWNNQPWVKCSAWKWFVSILTPTFSV